MVVLMVMVVSGEGDRSLDVDIRGEQYCNLSVRTRTHIDTHRHSNSSLAGICKLNFFGKCVYEMRERETGEG